MSGCELAKPKLPERLEIIDEFRMTSSEKIKEDELWQDIARKLGATGAHLKARMNLYQKEEKNG